MTRISIAKILGTIGLVGLMLAALRSASAGWVILVQMVTLSFFLSAIVGCVFGRGALRAFWFGFAIFVCGMFYASHIPNMAFLGADDLTRWLIVSLPDRMFARKWVEGDTVYVRSPGSDRMLKATISEDYGDGNYELYGQEPEGKMENWKSDNIQLHRSAVKQIALPLLTLAFGLLGAWVGRSFYSSKSSPPPGRPGE